MKIIILSEKEFNFVKSSILNRLDLQRWRIEEFKNLLKKLSINYKEW